MELTKPTPALAKTPSRRWSIAAVGGAILSAFLASACCLGPLVFALLGLGSAGLLMKFEPYRPYFMVLTLGMLGVGFYFTYRKPRVAEAGAAASTPDCDCEHPKSNKLGRILLWVATAVVLGFLLFPYVG
ncbi:MAG: mercuric transporter MerT family protein [Deltaproteobacteria bacterium]